MSISRIFVGVSSVCLTLLTAGVVYGQNFPSKPIRILTQSVGGNPDFASRVIAQAITGPLGQPVVVENRGSLIILGEVASKAPPDGYTLLLTAGSLWLAPLVQKNVPYNVVKDFSPITAVARSASFLVVHPSLPVKTTKELIALAKARPGALNYVSGVIGGADHLAAELFKSMAGVNITHIPYSNTAQMMADLVGGQAELSFPPGATTAGYIKSGRLRALAVTSAERSAVFPELPTVAAVLPGYEAVQILGLWAPVKTPLAIINRLNQEVVRVLNRADTKEKFFNVGVETVGSSPQQFAAIINSEVAKWGKLIRDVGIHVD